MFNKLISTTYLSVYCRCPNEMHLTSTHVRAAQKLSAWGTIKFTKIRLDCLRQNLDVAWQAYPWDRFSSAKLPYSGCSGIKRVCTWRYFTWNDKAISQIGKLVLWALHLHKNQDTPAFPHAPADWGRAYSASTATQGGGQSTSPEAFVLIIDFCSNRLLEYILISNKESNVSLLHNSEFAMIHRGPFSFKNFHVDYYYLPVW